MKIFCEERLFFSFSDSFNRFVLFIYLFMNLFLWLFSFICILCAENNEGNYFDEMVSCLFFFLFSFCARLH